MMKERKVKLQQTDKTWTGWADLYGLKQNSQLEHPTVKHLEEVKLPQTQKETLKNTVVCFRTRKQLKKKPL